MVNSDMQRGVSNLVQSKLDDFFWEWLSLQESQKIIWQAVQYAKSNDTRALEAAPSASFSALSSRVPGSPSGRTAPSPPGSPHSKSGLLRESSLGGVSTSDSATSGSEWSSAGNDKGPTSPTGPSPLAKTEPEPPAKPEITSCAAGTASSQTISRFWWPKRQTPSEALPQKTRQRIHDYFAREGLQEITTHTQLEPIVTEIFGLSRYFVVPIFHKIKVFYDIIDDAAVRKAQFLTPSPEPISEQMIVGWAQGRIQPDDPVLSFFYVVKKDHNNWIEREDFGIFLTAILLTHPGLDFLRETTEFQERYADTVISRIFFVYDRKDTGRIYLPSLRRYKPSVIETWKQLADHDDIKMVRDYFSYEHFYVIYCTFWELDSDHDFLLDKDDLLKYDGHTLARRAVDRIFSEIPARFTSAVSGKMGYEDFIRFLLCDQDRQTDRSVEYWFSLFDLDGDGCICDHEMKYFYEEQVQRMECLNYETISFADIMCQVSDMISPKYEGKFRLADFKRRRKFAGTFFSLFSSLSKFLSFEHNDPSGAKQEQLENPTFSDWDRWCQNEYLRLAMEENEEPEEDTRVNDDGGG
eukprot:TRINITY_DN80725_c0_g1_i1.p1 TRINITY_DN80725_c0_g1~~TRINITY_DN80725_c0_g1_i1.p1  ORF type:complete len:580 (+),score=95.67 TRINITY_DN80725_c0_g1_i1:142-1881(+)